MKPITLLLAPLMLSVFTGTAYCAPRAAKKTQLADGLYAEFNTTRGKILTRLFYRKVPLTEANFVGLAEGTKDFSGRPEGKPFYDGLKFHRVIKNFMIQGGGFTADMQQKPTRSPIKNEADNGLKNERGTLSMARTSEINSATSQFFINVESNAVLDHGSRDFGYAVFARVVEGMDMVDRIAAVKTGSILRYR